MPYVNVQMIKGATRAQKAQLVREMTDSLVRILTRKPEHTHVATQEIAEADWGFLGLPTDDWKKPRTIGLKSNFERTAQVIEPQ